MSEERTKRSAKLRTLLELPVILLISFALVFGFVRPVIAAPFYVGSESMVPTLKVWDRVLINKLAYDLGEPERGDIVLFQSPKGGEDPLIKRIVGLPGDTIKVRRDKLFVNGESQREPYVNDKYRKLQGPYGPRTVPEDHVFVMGDNRGNSQDSRYFGPVPEENLIGEALFRFWPPGRVGSP
ncbi:MAG: signal peptidase I [Actinomycetota bacterium]|nr:signal peptidase I [Actinomycetota bacterium]